MMAKNITLAELVTTLKRRLKDEEFDEALLKDFINDAHDEILGEIKYSFLEKEDGPFEVERQGELDLPFDFQSTIQIYVKIGKRFWKSLDYVSSNDFFNSEKGDRYFKFCVFGNKIYYRLPRVKDACCDCDCGCFDLFHLYLAKPKKLVKDTDMPVIPYEYIEALILGVMFRAEQSRGNFDFAQIYRNQQDEVLTNMKWRYGVKNQSIMNRGRAPFYNGGTFDYGC